MQPVQDDSSEVGRTPLLRLRVTPAAERALRAGHPWVFAERIIETNRAGKTGELAVVYDKRNQFLALGLFDANSPIRFRSLQVSRPRRLDRAWWAERLENAWRPRTEWFDSSTNGHRCIHGESDGWPGLVLDRYDRTFVLKLYTAAWFVRLREIVELIGQQLHPERVVLRLSRNLQAEAARFALADGQLLDGPALSGPVTFLESGLQFESDVIRGQKTGFFLDQRDNRRAVAQLARGRTVLNGFSFSGGFSVYAASGGATAATDLDISRHALEAARRNFDLNRGRSEVAACRHETVQADAFEWLSQVGDRQYGLIVLDPPSLATRETEKAAALAAYFRLAGFSLRRLERGGILVACSCTAHVSAGEFFDQVRKAGASARRPFRELRTSGHPADHRPTFKEAEYLKAIYLQLAN